MGSAWSGKLFQLRDLVNSGTFIREIYQGFASLYSPPSPSEMRSWEVSIPALLSSLSDPIFDNLQIIIELSMPIGSARSDIVLLGGSLDTPRYLVIELKQWENISVNPDTLEVEVPGLEIQQHPSKQALNYTGKLHFFKSRAHSYEDYSAVYLHNASNDDKALLSAGNANKLVLESPLFSRLDSQELAAFVENLLIPISLPDDEHLKFSQSPYEQSHHLFTFLQDHAVDIARNSEISIANSGMGLTSQQDRIKNEIILALQQTSNIDFIIQGNPGSGKTLLAVSLLLNAAENKRSCILALRNNRLQAILRKVFDDAYPGVSGLMEFFEPQRGGGIARFDGHVDLLIIDEAQRMENRIISTVLSKADVCAVFLDETQRLNPPEEGTINNFSQASLSISRKPIVRYLDATIRCRGGQPYSDWVESLLSKPSDIDNLLISNQYWKNNYIPHSTSINQKTDKTHSFSLKTYGF